jgi:hypothetical protein
VKKAQTESSRRHFSGQPADPNEKRCNKIAPPQNAVRVSTLLLGFTQSYARSGRF